MTPDIAQITSILGAYRHYAIIGALSLAFVVLIATIRRVSRKPADDKPRGDHLSNVVTGMVLILTAEGMFWVLTTKLSMPLPWWLAIFVCAVAEGLMVNFFRLAKTFNSVHGRPGPFGTAFWIVAVAEGAIVALASNNVVEVALRILLPLGVALLHWIKLTAENRDENRGRFVWTPLNLLIRIGAWRPGDTTITEAEAHRAEMKLTNAAFMLATARSWQKARRLRRVRRMVLAADPATAAAVVARLELAYGIEARIMAVTTAGQKAVDAASGVAPIDVPSTTPPTPHVIDVPATNATNANGVKTNGNRPAITGVPSNRAMTAFARTTAERDTDIIIRYWDDLIGLMQAGTICRSAIERACTVGTDKVLARQANRILDIMSCAITLAPELSVQERVQQAITTIAESKS